MVVLFIGVVLSSVGAEDVCLLGVLFHEDCLLVGVLFIGVDLSLVGAEDICLIGVSLFVDVLLVGVLFTASELADLRLDLVALGTRSRLRSTELTLIAA